MKTSMFILCALTFVTPVSKAEVVNVADHGIVPGKDVTLEVNRLIASLKGRSEISHRQQWGLTFAEVGDRIMITSRETVLPLFETTVENVEVLNERRLMIRVSELSEKLPEGPLSLENLTWYPDVVMRKNIIRNNRARSALITTKGKVLIEDNRFLGFDWPIRIEQSSDTANVRLKNNQGLTTGTPKN